MFEVIDWDSITEMQQMQITIYARSRMINYILVDQNKVVLTPKLSIANNKA